MSALLTILLVISMIGSLIGACYFFITAKRWKALILSWVIVGVVFLFLHTVFGFPSVIKVEEKGPVEEAIVVVLCYLCMIAGMVAQYFYNQGKEGQSKFTFELVPFFMPFFVSPILFIPLVLIIQDIPTNFGAFTKSKVMIYLVAFQNGFFWRDIVNQQRQKISGNSTQ